MEERASESFRARTAAQVLRFDPSRSAWTDIDMDLLLRIDISRPHAGEPSGRSEILIDAGFALQALTQAFALTMNRNAAAIQEAAALGANHPTFALPWMPWLDRRIVPEDAPGFEIQTPGFHVERPLAGQRFDEQRAVGIIKLAPLVIHLTSAEERFSPLFLGPDDPRSGVPIATLAVLSMGFDEGSLFHWLKVRAGVLALAISLLGAPPVTKSVEFAVNEYGLHHAIANALQANAPAVEFRGFRFSGAELDKLGIRAFNYEEPGISEDEKFHRVALCQLAFRIAFRTDIAIDGSAGPETSEHLKRLAALHNLPAAIRNEFLRAELLNALQPPFPKW